MKNLKHTLFVAMAVSIMSILSCSKDDDGGSAGNTGEGTITATVNGQQFTTLEITSAANTATGGGNVTLVLQGNTASQGVGMIINGYTGVGTYELSDSNIFTTANYVEPNASDPLNTQIWNAPYQDSGVVGEINVAEDANGRVKGTFNYTAKNQNDGSVKTISDGSFDLAKTEN